MIQIGNTNSFGNDIFILKGIFAEGHDTMESITIDSDNAGVYTIISDDGSSGDITFSINGGSFISFSSPLELAISDTLIVMRTITSSIGYYKLTGSN